MKPAEARRRVLVMEQERESQRQRLEELVRDGAGERVVPELIPDDAALTLAQREARALVRRVVRTPKGGRRQSLAMDAVGAIARVLFAERVMAMDSLARAALTPSRMLRMHRAITFAEVSARYDSLRRGGRQ